MEEAKYQVKGACIRALLPAILAAAVASCGNAAKPAVPTPPSKSPATVQPPVLPPTSLPVAIEPGTERLVASAIAGLHHSQPQVSVKPSQVAPASAPREFLSHQPPLAVLAVSLPTPVQAQLGAAAAVDLGVTRVWLGYNLPGVSSLVLDSKAIVGIISGKLSTWNAPEIAALNPSESLPPSPITISPVGSSSATMAILEGYAAAVLKVGAVSTPRCTTTIGCLDIALSQPALPVASALTANQTATLPLAAGYPLATPVEAIIAPDHAHPAVELAATLLTIQLVEEAPPSPTRQASLARLASLSSSLSILASSGSVA